MDARDDEEFRDWMRRDYVSARTTVGGVVPDQASRAQQRCTVGEAEAPMGGVGPLPDLGDDAGDGFAAACGHFLGMLSAYVEQWGPDPRADDAFAFMRAVIDARDALYVRPRPL
mmetsp:Transcript_17344/g.45574  ORF Transcript_17344/g.45574 Transcript_17344/m.45574 type:complete len:114 (-) Transcript_17344:19-360(-)